MQSILSTVISDGPSIGWIVDGIESLGFIANFQTKTIGGKEHENVDPIYSKKLTKIGSIEWDILRPTTAALWY